MIENVVDQKGDTLLKFLHSKIIVYTNKNIFITILYMDKKFEVLRDALQDKIITLNIISSDKYVPQIKKKTKVVKERVRITWNSLP